MFIFHYNNKLLCKVINLQNTTMIKYGLKSQFNSKQIMLSKFVSFSVGHNINNQIVMSSKIQGYVSANGISTHKKICSGFTRKIYEDAVPKSMDEKPRWKSKIESGPGLKHFISSLEHAGRPLTKRELKQISHPYITLEDVTGYGRNVFFEVHGCQMNVSDTDIAWSVLKDYGYSLVHKPEDAHVILIMTCAIREGAETKIWDKLKNFRQYKKNKRKNVKIGVLGCMAERLKMDLIEKEGSVDIVAGPDSYKDLPRLLAISETGEKSLNVLLSHDETYANIKPVSISSDKVSGFVSIMRGCDNLCTYCIVPFTRGKERSRDIGSILEEIRYLSDQGIKEVILLGQNVNSYRDMSLINSFGSAKDNEVPKSPLAKGFKTVYKDKVGGRRFADLLDKVSLVNPEIRIRFTSPHPKDFPDEVLQVIKERPNICKCLHLPAQSGNTRILELMRRGYSREAYLELVLHIRSIIPTISLTSDFICGFCGETDDEFKDSMSMLQSVQYSFCYIFPYSMREKTAAYRNLEDTVPHAVKIDRVNRLHSLFRDIALELNFSQIGKRQLVLVEGLSKRSKLHLAGRNDGNIKVIVPDVEMEDINEFGYRHAKPGDYIDVIVTGATSQTLTATPVKLSSIKLFSS